MVELTAAAAEVRHAVGPAALLSNAAEGLRVLALAAAFEAVEQHQVALRTGGRDLIDVDEVAVRRGPALACEDRRGAQVAA